MNRSVSKFLQITIPLALGVFLIWFVYDSFTPEQLVETKKYFEDANYGFVFLAVFLSTLSHLSRAYRWNFMLEPLGYKSRLANNFMAISVAYLLNIFIPKSGEVSRAIIVDRYENIPFQKGFGTIISERVIDLLFLFLFTTAALIIEFDALYTYVKKSVPSSILFLFGIGILLIAMSIPLYIKFSKSNVNKKIKTFVMGLKEGIFSIHKMRKKKEFLLHSLFIWILYVLSFYSSTQALPETATIPFGTMIITFVVGSFTIGFTNSGFGTYPAAIAGILSIFGVATTAGVAFGWIVWISNITSIVIFGVLSLILLPLFNRKQL
ncbi:MAG TPA: lysylphosphatidylglycerol synthase transmembrane domain-containing protein [Aequorivita sp.]|nr:lysylphosphatidylglycerol synthase transmembrane domain-containing protein [Aequorivita sp.]